MCRYNLVREELLSAPGGREALLDGIPDHLLELQSVDMAKIGSILQVSSPHAAACTCKYRGWCSLYYCSTCRLQVAAMMRAGVECDIAQSMESVGCKGVLDAVKYVFNVWKHVCVKMPVSDRSLSMQCYGWQQAMLSMQLAQNRSNRFLWAAVQQPYEELDAADISDDEDDKYDVVGELLEEAAPEVTPEEAAKDLKRSDTLFYDAGAAFPLLFATVFLMFPE